MTSAPTTNTTAALPTLDKLVLVEIDLSMLRSVVALLAMTVFVLGLSHVSTEIEPLFYVPRLVMFGLIIVAIVQKNRPTKPGR